MFYYEVKDVAREEIIGIVSSESKLEKKTMVVVPDDYGNVVTATIERPVKTIEALSTGYDLEEIICTVDITKWKAGNLAKVKKAQLKRIMNEKMDEIKNRELLEKFANKDNDFKDLLKEYDSLGSDLVEEESEEESA